MNFQWGRRKAASNSRKQDVALEEATTALRDPLSATARDPDHSGEESRFVTFGVSSVGHLLVVSRTARENSICTISARLATKGGRSIYEEG